MYIDILDNVFLLLDNVLATIANIPGNFEEKYSLFCSCNFIVSLIVFQNEKKKQKKVMDV